MRFSIIASLLPFTAIAQSQECYDYPGWHAADGSQYTCSWYAGTTDNGVPNCDVYGSSMPYQNATANDACCICGGGYEAGQIIPSLSPTETPDCINFKDFKVVESGTVYTCTWYGEETVDYIDDNSRCTLFGNDVGTDGRTPNEACCVCGGGTDDSLPSAIPTSTSSPTMSDIPSAVPTISFAPVASCTDIPGWLTNDGYNCSWYEGSVPDDDTYYGEDSTRCTLYGGNLYANMGYNAFEACCVCGGGLASGPSPAPSLISTGNQTDIDSPTLAEPTSMSPQMPTGTSERQPVVFSSFDRRTLTNYIQPVNIAIGIIISLIML